MAIPTKSVSVPHLNGSLVSYATLKPITSTKPTVVLINSFATNATLFKPQFSDPTLLDAINLIALEPFGHGNTKANGPTFTFWDSAIAFVQVLDKLGVNKAFVLGASQGGFIAARMALYAPDRVAGLILAGTGLDSESPRMKKLGALDLTENMLPVITQLTASANSSFSLPAEFPKNTLTLAFGANTNVEDVKLFTPGMTKTYSGDDGRLRLRQSAIALLSRDSLHLRLSAITSPVLWIQGSEDKVFPLEGVKEELGLLGSKNTKLETISGGAHVSSWAHAAEFNKLVATFVATYGGKEDARKLREAVGMVEM